jgi:hypothetical protein
MYTNLEEKERRKRNVAAIFKIGRPLVICQRENE